MGCAKSKMETNGKQKTNRNVVSGEQLTNIVVFHSFIQCYDSCANGESGKSFKCWSRHSSLCCSASSAFASNLSASSEACKARFTIDWESQRETMNNMSRELSTRLKLANRMISGDRSKRKKSSQSQTRTFMNMNRYNSNTWFDWKRRLCALNNSKLTVIIF